MTNELVMKIEVFFKNEASRFKLRFAQPYLAKFEDDNKLVILNAGVKNTQN
jgi:hypothetical protein